MAVLIGYALYNLIDASLEKDRAVKQELFARDLRQIVAGFDTDERFVLSRNLTEFLSARRSLSPLLLPRSYYAGLSGIRTEDVPRPPPRNCFVDLIRASPVADAMTQVQDRFCAYFTPIRDQGPFLFLSLSFVDDDLVLHKLGDTSLAADAVELDMTSGERHGTWLVVLQRPREASSSDRVQLTAYKDIGKGRLERDRRIEGWGYVQKRRLGTPQVIHVLARLDYRLISSAIVKGNDDWPPAEFYDTKFVLTRRDASSGSGIVKTVKYGAAGISTLSLPALYSSLSNPAAVLHVKQAFGTILGQVATVGAGDLGGKDSFLPVRLIAGDLVFNARQPVRRELSIPDTALSLEVVYPGLIIEKTAWSSMVALVLLLLLLVALAITLMWQVLGPVNRMAKHATALAVDEPGSTVLVPYANKRNEIGTLARVFNDLLTRTREHVLRQQDDRSKAEEARRRDNVEQMRAREASLRTIGHEIRSPLQALLAMHGPESPTHRYVERMARAVDHLYGSAGPEAGFSGMRLTLEKVDVADFAATVARNAPYAGIHHVVYSGPMAGVCCSIDEAAFEDALTHILNNADRYRHMGTDIVISLSVKDRDATIAVSNVGQPIPEQMLEQIFELGVSLDQDLLGARQGQGLYVVKSYVRKMGGDVTAANTPDGVVVEVTLPLSTGCELAS